MILRARIVLPISQPPVENGAVAISGNKITLEVPLSDSIDSKYLNPPATAVVKVRPPARLTQIGIEHLHIESPAQSVNHTQELYTALRLNGEDCWVRDVNIDETMNSVSIGKITKVGDHYENVSFASISNVKDAWKELNPVK